MDQCTQTPYMTKNSSRHSFAFTHCVTLTLYPTIRSAHVVSYKPIILIPLPLLRPEIPTQVTIYIFKCVIVCPCPTCGPNLGNAFIFCCCTGTLLPAPGYGFLSPPPNPPVVLLAFFCSTGGVNDFGAPGLTAVFLSELGNALLVP